VDADPVVGPVEDLLVLAPLACLKNDGFDPLETMDLIRLVTTPAWNSPLDIWTISVAALLTALSVPVASVARRIGKSG
jgi:hypothetical protein